MSILRRFLARLRSKPPVIMTEWGPVSECARLQAALNMRDDPALRHRVEEILIKELGSQGVGLREARRRYPEAYGKRA